MREGTAVAATTYKVRVTKDYLVFSSGHFITYGGGQCERIHGHNYRVAVEVEDDLDENHYVFDFIALKSMTRAITSEIDHRMLLPTRSELIRLSEEGPNCVVRYGERHWSFPRDECAFLPIANTTVELLADYLAGRLRESFLRQDLHLPRTMRVEVEECFGQSAEVEWVRDSASESP
jgi:6-pyruvoyltetrahydropterin/6-carboxytetrahydropterin synthase